MRSPGLCGADRGHTGPLTSMPRGRFSGGRSGVSGTRKSLLACLRERSRFRSGALVEVCCLIARAASGELKARVMATKGPQATFCSMFSP